MAVSPGLGCGDVQQVGWCLWGGLGVAQGRKGDAQPMGREEAARGCTAHGEGSGCSAASMLGAVDAASVP